MISKTLLAKQKTSKVSESLQQNKNHPNKTVKKGASKHRVISYNDKVESTEVAGDVEVDTTDIHYVKSNNEESDDQLPFCVDCKERDVVILDRSVLSGLPNNQSAKISLSRQDAFDINDDYDVQIGQESFNKANEDIESEKISFKSKVNSDEAMCRISQLYTAISSQSDQLEFDEDPEVKFFNPELAKMLEEAEIWGFVSPEKERKVKNKKRVSKKTKTKKRRTVAPKQPPYLLSEYFQKTSNLKKIEIVPPLFKTERSYDIDTTHMTAKVYRLQPENEKIEAKNKTMYSELAKSINKFDEKNQKMKKKQSCLNGRLAFSKNICRFDLPQIIYELEEMSPMDYLRNHCHVVSRRKNLYLAAFQRQILRRTFDISRHITASKNTNINRLGFSSGSAASPLGILRNVEINAEDDDLLYNSKTRMKDFKKLLTFKETMQGIIDIHMEGITSKQLQHTLNLLHIGHNSLIDANVFCSLCALTERFFYSKYSLETTDITNKKPYVESADFYNLLSQMYKLKIHPGINKLFDMI